MNLREKLLFGNDAKTFLKRTLQAATIAKRKIFLLQDLNTQKHCIPLFRELSNPYYNSIISITISAGEANKTLDTVAQIWKKLTENGAGRDALLLNLGGGVVTDIGGFAASCYKRGIATMHIPTSLLGMVDAAIGGKTGVDFDFFKNHIGSFYPAEAVLIFPEFLSSLPMRELRSGLGEVLKYGLIRHPEILDGIPSPNDISQIPEALIVQCAMTKKKITDADPTENGERKILNFGHTIGHALESFALQNEHQLLHGEAIAAGMVAELWISMKQCGLDEETLLNYQSIYNQYFEKFSIQKENLPEIVERAYHDKKNSGGELRFVLLNKAGEAIYDIGINEEIMFKSLEYYIINA